MMIMCECGKQVIGTIGSNVTCQCGLKWKFRESFVCCRKKLGSVVYPIIMKGGIKDETRRFVAVQK